MTVGSIKRQQRDGRFYKDHFKNQPCLKYSLRGLSNHPRKDCQSSGNTRFLLIRCFAGLALHVKRVLSSHRFSLRDVLSCLLTLGAACQACVASMPTSTQSHTTSSRCRAKYQTYVELTQALIQGYSVHFH